MSEETILGYDAQGKPIHPPKPGMMYTQCIVSCSGCNHIISGVGGPKRGALCVNCFGGVDQEADFNQFEHLAAELSAMARDAGGIIQNVGYKPTKEDIEAWTIDCDAKLNTFIQRYRAHVRRVGLRLHRGLYK